VYWSFLGGYDETALVPTRTECLPRLVFGAVLTPNPGLWAGFGVTAPWADLRHLSLNAGYTVMLATVPVGSLSRATKTRRGALGAWIVQVGYGF
jgi:hypothetical protein